MGHLMWWAYLECPVCAGVYCDCEVQLQRWARGDCSFCGALGRAHACPCSEGFVGRGRPGGLGLTLFYSVVLHVLVLLVLAKIGL